LNCEEHDADAYNQGVENVPPAFVAGRGVGEVFVEANHLHSADEVDANAKVQYGFERYEPTSFRHFESIDDRNED